MSKIYENDTDKSLVMVVILAKLKILSSGESKNFDAWREIVWKIWFGDKVDDEV